MVKVKVVLILLSVQINILHGVLPLQPWPPEIVVAPFPQVSSRPSPAMLYYQARDHSVFLPVRGQQRFFSPVSTQNFSRLVTKHFTFSDVQQRIKKRFAQIYQLPVSPCALSHIIRWREMGPRNVQTVVFWWFKAEPLLDLRDRHKTSIKSSWVIAQPWNLDANITVLLSYNKICAYPNKLFKQSTVFNLLYLSY
jgi:hypothetical protein